MMHRINAAVLCAGLASGASAAPTIELLPVGFLVTDASYNGSVLVGNVQGDGSYETFRWTAETGVERLGRATVPAIGVGGGSPDVSYNGRRVSAGILSSDNLETQGVWDVESGWTETMPPLRFRYSTWRQPARWILAPNSVWFGQSRIDSMR